MTKNTILGIFLAGIMLCGSIPLGFSEPVLQQWKNTNDINEVSCDNSNHILVMGDTGNPACVTEKSAKKLGWIPIHDSIVNLELERSVELETTMRTETTILSDKQLSITNIGKEGQNLIGDLMGYTDYYFWPQHTLSFPEEVRVGEPFDVVLDYAFLTPTIDYDEFGIEFEDWSNPELVCNEWCEDHEISIIRPSNVVLVDRPDYVFENSKTNMQFIPNITYEGGNVHPPFNNSTPQQETFTFVINKPTHDYNYGQFEVSYPQSGMEQIYFYIDPFGTVHLSDMRIPVQIESMSSSNSSLQGSNASGFGMESEIMYGDQLLVEVYTFEESTPADTKFTDPPDEFIPDLAEFLKEAYEGRDYSEMLHESGLSDEFIEKFFKVYPELDTRVK